MAHARINVPKALAQIIITIFDGNQQKELDLIYFQFCFIFVACDRV